MRFSKRLSVLAFGLLFGGICAPGARASVDETPAEGLTLGLQAPNHPVTVAYLTALAPQPAADADLPDEPGARMQQQVREGSGAPDGAVTAPAQDPLAQGRQTKRILFVIPNFRAVSADEQLPPQTVKDKFKTAMLDSVDYSSFIFVGAQAGIAQATNSYPYFGQGARGYGRYYWHTLADAINENTWVEFIIPSVLHQDTRFYTLGKGQLSKRAGYAITRIFITRTDDGNRSINYGEIVGAGAFAGIANLYYPSPERTLVKTYQRWVTNLAIDGGVFVFKEVWPDINNSIFHQKD
jgi:hypothetical protein